MSPDPLSHRWGLGTRLTTDALAVLAAIHPRVYERSKAVPGCMADRYCGSTFYPPMHHGTTVFFYYMAQDMRDALLDLCQGPF